MKTSRLAANRDFSTEIDNLYVCDDSTLPVSSGASPSLFICSMSMLFGKVNVENRFVSK